MPFKNVSLFLKTLIPISLIAVIGVLTFFLNAAYERKARLDTIALEIVERNVSMVNVILLNSERIFTQEQLSKKEIKTAETLFDFSLSVLKNGGIVPEYDEDVYLPYPGRDILDPVLELEKTWFNFKEPLTVIYSEPAFAIIKTPKDSIINGRYQRVTAIERIKNSGILSASSQLNNESKVIVQKSQDLENAYRTRIADFHYKRKLSYWLFIILIFGLSGSLVFVIRSQILKHLAVVADQIAGLEKSEDVVSEEYKNQDELKPLYENLAKLRHKISDLSMFVNALKKGFYDSRLAEYNRESPLEKGLVDLRDKLQKSQDEGELAKIAEDKRKWAIEGQTKFNEILRNSASNVQELSDSVLKNLVIFVEAAQGGIFLKVENEDESYLELFSAFAYDRKKFFTKRIAFGNGLVGMVALEKNTVWLDKIPQNYMEVESGLGEAPPKSLLIVPLKTEAELLGVLEIASLNKMTKDQVQFIENLAQSIASTIQSAKISERTTELLSESQKKSEELAARDAEMRKSIKELQKAQAEADKNEAEMTALITALDQTMLTAEISSRKRVVSANRQFLTKADYHFDEIENKPFFPMFIDSDRTADDIFDSVMKGETIRVTQKMVSKYKTEFWILGQYTPVKDAGGKISKILFLGNDISRRIDIENKNAKLLEETLEKAELLSQQEKEMRRNFLELMDTQKEIKDKEFEVNTLLTAIDINLVKSEFDEKGNLLNANKKFIETFKYSKAEISNLTIENIVDKQTSPEFDALWLNLFSKDEAFQFEVETKNNEDETIWLMTSFTPLKNEEGQIIKIVFLANEITEHKKAQFKIHTQSQNLLHQEELMKLNMEEMLDEQEKLSAKLQEYLHVEESLGTEFETDSDKIYNKWVQTL